MKRDKGFVTTILIIIIALALLKYFLNWSIFDAASSEQGQSTIGYVRDILNTIWDHIGAPVAFVWNEVVKPLFEFAFSSLLQMIQEGREASGR